MRWGIRVALFTSGLASLVFQVVWFRQCALEFGVTQFAAAVVLALFMLGLGIGNALSSRLNGSHSTLCRVYAASEALIGIVGFALTWLLSASPPVGVIIVMMLVATTAMGITFPLAVRITDRDQLGGLYAWNTAGAVLGTLLCGFLLLPMLGFTGSALIALTCDIGVAILLWRISFNAEEVRGVVAEPSSGATTQTTVLLVALGAIGLGAEVALFRVCAIASMGVVYGFTLLLAAVLCGIALGGWSVKRAASEAELQRNIGRSFFLLGILLAGMPLWIAAGTSVLHRGLPGSRVVLLLTLLAISVVCFWNTGYLFAALFRHDRSQSVGGGYAANMLGAVGGAMGIGFVGIPMVGTQGSFIVLGLLAVACAFRHDGKLSLWKTGLAMAVLIGCSYVPLHVLTLQATRMGPGDRVLWSREDAESSVAVIEQPPGGRYGGGRYLMINGEIHATEGAREAHRRFGTLAGQLKPDAKTALMIGLGSGTTAGSIASIPGVQMTVVELSPGVIEAAKWFGDSNFEVSGRKNIRWIIGDGRRWVRDTKERFDLIEGDLLEPRHAGASMIYSREYFDSLRRGLRPNGIVLQWVGSPGREEYAWVADTFASAFPYVSWWMNGTVAVGSNEPQPFDGGEENDRTRCILTDSKPLLEYFLTLPIQTRMMGGCKTRGGAVLR